MSTPSKPQTYSPEIHALSNGLTVIFDEMPEVNSVAYSLMIPGGIVHDEVDRIGEALLLGELLQKGAGNLNARDIANTFDYHAINHGEGSAFTHFYLNGSCIANKLDKALELLALLTLQATLPSNYMAPLKSVLLQDIESLSDNPARLCNFELHKNYFPTPYNYSSIGTQEGIESITHDHLVQRYKMSFKPQGSVLSLAGRFTRDEVLVLINNYFANWHGTGDNEVPFGSLQPFGSHFVKADSNQTQIAFAFPAAKFGDDDYYVAKIAHQIMSGGMFGRLFMEVREKRGLCYSVNASHRATHLYGATFVYAGTTPERARETLSTIDSEFMRIVEGIADDELERAIANQLSSVFLSEDSSGSRASSNAGDWWSIRRIRSLSEIEEAYLNVSKNDVLNYFNKYKATPRTMMIVGREALV